MFTSSQEKRVIESIAECDRFISKEEKRNPSLRTKEASNILSHAIAHRQNLINALSGDAEAERAILGEQK